MVFSLNGAKVMGNQHNTTKIVSAHSKMKNKIITL